MRIFYSYKSSNAHHSPLANVHRDNLIVLDKADDEPTDGYQATAAACYHLPALDATSSPDRRARLDVLTEILLLEAETKRCPNHIFEEYEGVVRQERAKPTAEATESIMNEFR